MCDICPNNCKSDIGICGNRKENSGRFSAISNDPIEKKPFYHVYPGSKTLSFGGIGCNLQCPWCQNWHISHNYSNIETILLTPEELLLIALKNNSTSVSFTYNEPSIYYEYIVKAAELLQKKHIETFIVSSGYISEKYLESFYKNISAANIDIKCFNSNNYSKVIKGHLNTVLDTVKYLNSSKTWLELTNLIIPGFNDTPKEIKAMVKWIYLELGKEVPLHFSAFHPAYKYLDKKRTSEDILNMAYDIAKDIGLNFVYTGNIINSKNRIICPNCNKELIDKKRGICTHCNSQIPGLFK